MEMAHLSTKEEALFALEHTVRQEPIEGTEEDQHRWDHLVNSIQHRAEELGASKYEITRAWFAGVPAENRQGLFEVYLDPIEDGTISSTEELASYKHMLWQIAEDFNLINPLSSV